jgi:hypothetical protein
MKKIDDHCAAILFLKERGLKGSGVIGAYHARRVVPLVRVLPLYRIVPSAPLERTVLAEGRSPMPKLCNASRKPWRLCGTRWGRPRLLVPGVGAHRDEARCELRRVCKFFFLWPLSPSQSLDPARLTLSKMVPAEGSHPQGPPGTATKGCGREGSEPR